ncbi:MAG: metallopeptidase family protein [Thermoflexales bacterium]
MVKVSRAEFEQLVWEAVDTLPSALRDRIANLEIEVKLKPSPADLADADEDDPNELFGLYRGVPLTERGAHYDMTLPDLITIFQRPHELACNSLEELRAEVRRTVLHELAHHFGISDDRLDELDAY